MKLPPTMLPVSALAALLTLCIQATAEPRLAYAKDGPNWLQAVGKLNVPGVQIEEGRRRHQRENCSGTLIANPDSTRADLVVTAWHCLEFYRDVSKPISFTLLPGSQLAIHREAYRLADGGGMHADWALLKLHQPIDTRTVPAMVPNPQRGDLQRPVTMAGFSGDGGLGESGAVLTYHPQCQITRQQRSESETDCSAYKGASGGAVVQLSAQGQPQLTGVISRGNSEDLSIYVPLTAFRSSLERYLR